MTAILIIAGLITLTGIASFVFYADTICGTYFPIYKEACRHKIVPDIGLTALVPESEDKHAFA